MRSFFSKNNQYSIQSQEGCCTYYVVTPDKLAAELDRIRNKHNQSKQPIEKLEISIPIYCKGCPPDNEFTAKHNDILVDWLRDLPVDLKEIHLINNTQTTRQLKAMKIAIISNENILRITVKITNPFGIVPDYDKRLFQDPRVEKIHLEVDPGIAPDVACRLM